MALGIGHWAVPPFKGAGGMQGDGIGHRETESTTLFLPVLPHVPCELDLRPLCPHSQYPMPNAQCPMPNTQCPMPNAQCPMPNAQCPIPWYILRL